MNNHLTAAVATVVVAANAIGVPTASANSHQLSFYQVSGPARFHNQAGKPINIHPPATLPKAGDGFDETDTLYAGTATSHRKQLGGTDHMTCTFSNSNTGSCDLQIAVGGSMLLFNQFVLHFEDNSAVVRLSEATGQFTDVHGSLTIRDLPDGNSTFVVTLT
jgi:hypothetical protein